MYIEIDKKVIDEIIEILTSLEKKTLVSALNDAIDEDYSPPVICKKEFYSEDEGSATDEDLCGVSVDEDGFWSLK